MKTALRVSVLCMALVAVGFVVSGCQSVGKVSAKGVCATCPGCNMSTTTMAVGDVSYSKCVCPKCKKVSALTPAAQEALMNYLGNEVTEVGVCSHCKAVCAECPACRGM